MLTTLPTLKLRLAIPDADTTNDALLNAALRALSARFDKETNRTLARAAAFTQPQGQNRLFLQPESEPNENRET